LRFQLEDRDKVGCVDQRFVIGPLGVRNRAFIRSFGEMANSLLDSR
jgi:hypothetical protein